MTAYDSVFADEPINVELYDSPLGLLALAAIGAGIVLCEFSDPARMDSQLKHLQHYFKGPVLRQSNEHLQQLKHQLDTYFNGTPLMFSVPLVIPGTPFQQNVWRELQAIPYGETLSYQGLAQRLGDANAMRAVGTANGLNRIAIVIPCHRVINKNGKLGGYGGGLERKQWLLNWEAQHQPFLLSSQ